MLFYRGNAQYLFKRRLACQNSTLSIRLNAGVVRTSNFEHCLFADAFMNSRPKRLVNLDQFVNTGSASVTRHIALGTAFSVVELDWRVAANTQKFSLGRCCLR
jgi:hypothetical protein